MNLTVRLVTHADFMALITGIIFDSKTLNGMSSVDISFHRAGTRRSELKSRETRVVIILISLNDKNPSM
jgi:hypothetical protein